ncbi:hypothetical protein MnTg04_00788 [bacterium MnTg04]|nr:hypothetical protein MnTg04_00788 [bacterium MnTg04]
MHPVLANIGNFCIHRRAVFALAEILLGNRIGHAFEYRPIEGLALSQANPAQLGFHVLCLDALVAGDTETFDRWPFQDYDQQHAVIVPELNIIEKLGFVQRTDRFLQPLLIEDITDIDRQVIENGAIGYPLVAFDPHVTHQETVLFGASRAKQKNGQGQAHP